MIVGIVGLGYVGLPLMLRFVEIGFRVVGIDVDNRKNELLEKGLSYIQHISSEQVANAKGRITATSDFAAIRDVDAIILCVPTSLNKYREPDLSYIRQTTDALLPYIRAGQLISLESTTYPGTTEEELKPRIESTGLIVGQDIFLVYSPEREDPCNLRFTIATIPKICGGDSANCLNAGLALYSAVVDKVVPVSSTKVAEMTKLLENIHRSVNIGLVNEMKMLADKMGIDIHEVIQAAASKPFGFVPYYPGPGIGGHCIPIDPFYLTWKAREYGMHTRFIELAGEINSNMPHWVVNKVAEALNTHEKAIKNSKILVLGIAYKRNVDDVRESPSIAIMALLQTKGANISYSDPHVPVYFDLHSEEINAAMLDGYDCVILATAHDAFDYALIVEYSKIIIDTHGAFKKFEQINVVSA